MKYDVYIKNGIVIPHHEIEISTSRSGGAGGQHVNKTETKITLRWNLKNSQAFTQEQKQILFKNLEPQLTSDGDLIMHNSESRSQQQNLQLVLKHFADKIGQALYVPKKRIPTKISSSIKASRRDMKARRSTIKKIRSKKIDYD